VTAFCTYCSATKSHESGEIPAIRRYQGSRISKVYDAARALGFEFRVLSGEYGLVGPDQTIPYYDHLLTQPEVPALAAVVARQIVKGGITAFVYFTKPLATNPKVVPYHDALVAACRQTSASLFVVQLEDNSMNSWRAVMEEADRAKLTMVSDRAAGERAFSELLARTPNDGMIYFKRGEAYEALGERTLAAADFRRAMALFPMPEWKARAREALERVSP
jgi:tetratricopeptide (TPR) repeat protein